MTLSVGNHLVKLGADGNPITGEVHVEYEIVTLGTSVMVKDGDVAKYDGDQVIAVLKKVR